MKKYCKCQYILKKDSIVCKKCGKEMKHEEKPVSRKVQFKYRCKKS